MRNSIFFYLNLVVLNQKAMDLLKSIAHKWLKTVKKYYFVKMQFSEIIIFTIDTLQFINIFSLLALISPIFHSLIHLIQNIPYNHITLN